MNCPGCGYSNPEKIEHCRRCGSLLISEPVPEWRKEVAEKVRAYGDRKKRLTTPPGPLREQVTNEELAPVSPETSPAPPTPPPVDRPSPPVRIPPRPVVPREEPATAQHSANHPPVEIWSNDLDSDSEIEDASGLFLGRRCAAFLIDHGILGIMFSAILFCVSVWLRMGSLQLLKVAWPSALGIFLLIHFLYYVYFYITSRQTPGQVFLSLELKDPSSMQIPLLKIMLRWLAMIGFSLLNLLPVLFGKKLLLDDISGTEIRSLRHKRNGNNEWNIN